VTFKSTVSGDNGRYLESSQTYFVNGRVDRQLSPDADVMAQFGVSKGDWRAGREVANPLSVLEPTEQDSRALYLQLAYHKVESERREWRVRVRHSPIVLMPMQGRT
jgi:iron complex outermembrane receptor protein